MPLAGFEPTVPANELLQTHGIDLAAAGIGLLFDLWLVKTGVILRALVR